MKTPPLGLSKGKTALKTALLMAIPLLSACAPQALQQMGLPVVSVEEREEELAKEANLEELFAQAKRRYFSPYDPVPMAPILTGVPAEDAKLQEAFERARKQDPFDPVLRRWRAEVLLAMGKPQEAAREANIALNLLRGYTGTIQGDERYPWRLEWNTRIPLWYYALIRTYAYRMAEDWERVLRDTAILKEKVGGSAPHPINTALIGSTLTRTAQRDPLGELIYPYERVLEWRAEALLRLKPEGWAKELEETGRTLKERWVQHNRVLSLDYARAYIYIALGLAGQGKEKEAKEAFNDGGAFFFRGRSVEEGKTLLMPYLEELKRLLGE